MYWCQPLALGVQMTHKPTETFGTVCVITSVKRPHLFHQNELLFSRLPLAYNYSLFYVYFSLPYPEQGLGTVML